MLTTKTNNVKMNMNSTLPFKGNHFVYNFVNTKEHGYDENLYKNDASGIFIGV